MVSELDEANLEASSMASPDSSNQSDPVNNQSNPINNESIPKNPYFLSASEIPGSVLVTQPLLGMRNYHS